jgi:hypothetical protein
MEAEFLVESLGSNGFSFIKIDNLPSLVGIVILIIILVVNNNSLAFLVFTTSNIKDLVVSWVDKESSFESEQLEPSRVGAPDLHVSGFTCALNVP